MKRLRTCRKTDCRMKRLRTCRKTDCRMKRLRTCRKTDCSTNDEMSYRLTNSVNKRGEAVSGHGINVCGQWRCSSIHSSTSAFDRFAPHLLYPLLINPNAHWIGSWLGPRAFVHARSQIYCPHWESNQELTDSRPFCYETQNFISVFTRAYPEPVESIPHSSRLFLQDQFQYYHPVYAKVSLTCLMRATRLARIILLSVITLTTFCEQYELWSCLLYTILFILLAFPLT
jgi:hypothetical protein